MNDPLLGPLEQSHYNPASLRVHIRPCYSEAT